jgi:ABC-type antimicrobial peptide transport system permease subunit
MLSFSVTQRTREIAIRSALGATRFQVIWPVLARASAPLVIGTLAGFPLGLVLVSARGIFAFRLPDGSGPWGVPALALVMIVVGLAASWLPVRRALNISASEAMRAE